jgi:hypothetical protein
MRPITVSVGPPGTASANAIALSQSLAGPGNLILNGALVNAAGIAILSPPSQISITSAGNDKGLIWSLSGIGVSGLPIGEEIAAGTGPGTVTSQFTYIQINQISASARTASTVTAGNAAGAASSMIRLDEWADAPVGVQVSVNGTVNYTVQHTFDDPNDLINPVPVTSLFWDTGLVPAGAIGGTAGITFSIATAPLWMRIVLNSGTGSAKMVVTQFNVVEP